MLPRDDSPVGRWPAAFPATRISILERMRSESHEVRQEGFDALVRSYWKPIYKYLRVKWQLREPEAEDVTQSFLVAALDKAYLDAFDPSRARFRTFLRVCVDRFVMNERAAARAVRRGGRLRFVTLEFETAEGELRERDLPDATDLEEYFHREFVRDLFARTIQRVREECAATGRGVHFRLFERYDLARDDRATYASLASSEGLTVHQVTNYLAIVRRLFRTHALEQLRVSTVSDAEFRTEARELFGLELP
ncbi:MAG: hypothetical protein GEV06_23890 [Luteitalea sp.]|nr:hypothetical protein [Luteitalea sp.]